MKFSSILFGLCVTVLPLELQELQDLQDLSPEPFVKSDSIQGFKPFEIEGEKLEFQELVKLLKPVQETEFEKLKSVKGRAWCNHIQFGSDLGFVLHVPYAYSAEPEKLKYCFYYPPREKWNNRVQRIPVDEFFPLQAVIITPDYQIKAEDFATLGKAGGLTYVSIGLPRERAGTITGFRYGMHRMGSDKAPDEFWEHLKFWIEKGGDQYKARRKGNIGTTQSLGKKFGQGPIQNVGF